MVNIQVTLEPCRPFYRPGETITGYVTIDLPEDKKANKISLEARGRAHVTFWRRHGNDNHCYTADDTYLKTDLILWQKNSSNGEKKVPAGKTKYPFSVTIPYDAVPSLKATHGSICYTLKAELDLPWALDKHGELEFIVNGGVDFNCVPMYNQPHIAHLQKTGIFSSSSSMQATFSIPRLAWGAGEIIPIYCDITNNSSNDISGIEIQIIRRESFTGRTAQVYHMKVVEDCVRKIESRRIDVCIPTSTSKQVQVEFGVPPNLVTVTNCSIICIKYELEIELHTKGILSSCPSTCMPIVFFNAPPSQLQQPPPQLQQPPPQLQQPPQYPQFGFQPPSNFAQQYPSNPGFPATGQGAVPLSTQTPQSVPYPNAPPYPPYPSNPPIGASTSPSSTEYQKLSYERTEL